VEEWLLSVRRIVVVTADWEKLSGLVRRVCKEAAERLGVEVEERKEDWEYLVQHGVKDEYGGVDLPQVFMELSDGSVKHVLTRVPLDDAGKPSVEAAVKAILEAAGGGR